MEQQHLSTSKVTVEYSDPHGVYQLIGPGLLSRLPLRNLHWQSHAGPLRSIDTLHVELVAAGGDLAAIRTPNASSNTLRRSVSAGGSGTGSTAASIREDGFQTQIGGGSKGVSTDHLDAATAAAAAAPPPSLRRHQIPGLRRTPYLKLLLVRCDDGDTYKSRTRSEVREWVKANTPPSQSTRKATTQENHDAYEWLIIHVVVPNTAAAAQPRTGKGADAAAAEKSGGASRWRAGSSTLLEKLRSDFNGTGKGAVDRVVQIRVSVNDVPYDLLPRVGSAAPAGYAETAQDAENAWLDLVAKFKGLILSSFDMRVSQYEDDIKEKDAQRALPGWNFCTFFMLKEGLARGFESVGLVEDALVGYDELGVGLDSVLQEQAVAGDPERHGGALLGHTEELKQAAQRAVAAVAPGRGNLAAGHAVDVEDEETVDLQSPEQPQPQSRQLPQHHQQHTGELSGDIPISASKKPYRDMILANNVSVFDFRCYIFARQISLLLRLGNAWSTREELLARVKDQQESVLHGAAPPRAPGPRPADEAENLAMLAEICGRTLEFIPDVSQVMRRDLADAFRAPGDAGGSGAAARWDPVLEEVIDNAVASFAFSVAQQVLAQTSTKALPIPPSTLAPPDGHEPKASIPEPKTMMHPARSTSLHVRPGSRPPPSPNMFPGARRASVPEQELAGGGGTQFLKVGLEELAARRAELYTVSRNLLEGRGSRRGWGSGWADVPTVGEPELVAMEEIDLDDDEHGDDGPPTPRPPVVRAAPFLAGIDDRLLRAALGGRADFFRLYETLTDKALRHYTVAGQAHAVQANIGDLAVLKYGLGEFGAAASYFRRTVPFFAESGWSLLELSMLILYARCLQELQRKDDYCKVVLKLLTRAAAAEREASGLRRAVPPQAVAEGMAEPRPDRAALRGFVGELLAATKTLTNEWRVPLGSFFADAELASPPEYADRRDSFSLTVRLRSLLVDELPVDSARLHLSGVGSKARDVWVECSAGLVLKPGRNTIRLSSNTTLPGKYRVDQFVLLTSNLALYFERDAAQPPPRAADYFRRPDVTLHHRPGAFDVQLSATRHTHLDRNNSLEVEVRTGWNAVRSCELRVKAATGGLRLLTTEAKPVGDASALTKPPEAGLFTFGPLAAASSMTVCFPFSVEQDVPAMSVRLEASYETADGAFVFCDTPSIPVALALGVNVQDVFKHDALFSRFTVSTASASPMRLFGSELAGSASFDTHFGVAPAGAVIVFPKQPASLLYKITRRAGGDGGKTKTQRMLRLKLTYSVLLDEIEDVVRESLAAALSDGPLQVYVRLVQATVLELVRGGLSAYELERAALLCEVSTALLADADWASHFAGLGTLPGTDEDVGAAISALLRAWQQSHATLAVPEPTAEDPRSITIPVDIPLVPVLHTADIRLQQPIPSAVPGEADDAPVAQTNQLLPATLHLRWTRAWGASTDPAGEAAFGYDVTAPADAWLLGGRRRGRFAIPEDGAGSEVEGETRVPLLLVPLREGWLPYPLVEIRSFSAGEEGAFCEADCRNLGETIRVVADRERVTLSLDASGPGGGPLVLESQGRDEGRVVA